MMKDDNEDDLKNKEDLHIGGRHTALDIFRFTVFFNYVLLSVCGLDCDCYCNGSQFYLSIGWPFMDFQPFQSSFSFKIIKRL